MSISISIDADDLEWLEERAARVHGGNLSAAVAEGTRLLRHDEALRALLAELGAPSLSPAEVDALSAELFGHRPLDARPRPRPRRRAVRSPEA